MIRRNMGCWFGRLALAGVGLLCQAAISPTATAMDVSLVPFHSAVSAAEVLEDLPLSRPADALFAGHCRRAAYGYGFRAPVHYRAYYGSYGYPASYQYRAVVAPRLSYRPHYRGGYGQGYYGGYGHGYYGGYGGCHAGW